MELYLKKIFFEVLNLIIKVYALYSDILFHETAVKNANLVGHLK